MSNPDATTTPTQSEQSAVDSSKDEEVITQLTLAGLKVLMVRKGDQIIYKLPDNMSVSSISEEQRTRLMAEIQTLHAATMAAAIRANANQTSSSDSATSAAAVAAASAKTIAPKHNGITAPMPIAAATAGRPSAAESEALKETARKLREEFELEQQKQKEQQQQAAAAQSAAATAPRPTTTTITASSTPEVKTTRKYVKTGKYSKKRLQQQQQQGPQHGTPQQQQQQQQAAQQQAANQVQQLTQHQLLALQQSLQAMTGLNPSSGMSTVKPPMPLPSQFSTKNILAKRLPEEEAHHLEIKRRFHEALVADHKAVTNPDYETPFKSKQDMLNRLLPYHIYQYPKADLEVNKMPQEAKDLATIEIFKSQKALFERFAEVSKRMIKSGGIKQLQILIERQLLADQRQRLTEEQARVAAEQAAAQQQEMLRLHAEQQARIAAAAAAAAMMAGGESSIPSSSGMSSSSSNYAAGLAQATALLQNPNFASQLSPELQQQLLRNREQLAALLEQHSKENNSFNTPR